MSDRLFGLVVLIASAAYVWSALQIRTGFMMDPVGPKTFPILVGSIAGLCALLIVIKPDAEPEWPPARTWLSLAVALGVLVAYAYSLKPLGFLIPTALAAGILSWQISPRVLPAVATGLGLSGGLFLLFRFVLGLSLAPVPRGWLS